MGVALLALSASSYGFIPIFARFAYDAGSSPIALLAYRYAIVASVLLAAQWLRGRPLGLPPGRRLVGIATGLLFPVIAYGYLAAVARIPVNLAVLLFFTYPPLVALVAWLRGEHLGMRRAAAIVAAFLGTALALGVEINTLDPIGVSLALMGSLAYAFMILYCGRAMAGIDAGTLNLHVMTTCALVSLPIALATGQLKLPATNLGIFGVAGVVVTYFVGVVAFFAALKRIGPVRTALLSQLEPVVSIFAAVLILREQVSTLQGLGIALLMAALYALAR